MSSMGVAELPIQNSIFSQFVSLVLNRKTQKRQLGYDGAPLPQASERVCQASAADFFKKRIKVENLEEEFRAFHDQRRGPLNKSIILKRKGRGKSKPGN